MAKNLDVSNSNSDSNNILKTILIILIVIGIAYLIYYLYSQNNTTVIHQPSTMVNQEQHHQKLMSMHQEEKYRNITSEEEGKINITTSMKNQTRLNNPINSKQTYLPKGKIVGEEMIESFSQNADYATDRNNTSFPKEQLTAEELLPQDNSSLWAQVNPSGEGSLKDRNFLQSGYHIGINTVGQTLRNANLQLRSEPPCPQVKVSPWSQSTIEADLGRKPFEIGGCA